MNIFNNLILWVCLLSVSLLIPVTLPAGGIRKTLIEQREDISLSPIISLNELILFSTIDEKPSVLIKVKAGTPINILREWHSTDNGKWLLVDVLTQSSSHFFRKRGWVRVEFS